MKKLINIVTLIVAIAIGIVISNIIAGVYFKFKYGKSYYEKSIFCSGLTELSKEDLKAIEENEKLSLEDKKEAKVVIIDIPWQYFVNNFKSLEMLRNANDIKLKSINGPAGSYIEAAVSLPKEFLEYINLGLYSLAAAVTCESNARTNSTISIVTDEDTQAYSPPQLYNKDILMAVLPYKENLLPSNVLRIRVNTDTKEFVNFSKARIILTPVYLNPLTANYREQINFKKSDKTRIIAIGASTTYGIGVAHNATWPSILQQRLNYAYPGRFEVMNLATWGACAKDYSESFDKLLIIRYGLESYLNEPYGIKYWPKYQYGYRDLQPDIVLIAPCWNDIPASLMNLYYDKDFIFGLTFRQLDNTLATKLCRTPLGFFIYKAVNKIIFSVFIPTYSQEREFTSQSLKGSSKSKNEAILNKVSELKGEQKYMSILKNNYKHTLSDLCLRFKQINADVYLVSLPGMVFFSNEDEGRQIKDTLGYNEATFSLCLWGYTTAGPLERDSMSEISREMKVGFSDMLLRFKDYSFEDKTKIFSDLIHPTDLGNNFISAVIFHDLEKTFQQRLRDEKNI